MLLFSQFSVPDGKPVIGPVPGLPKVLLAAGHEGNGLCMVTFSSTKMWLNFNYELLLWLFSVFTNWSIYSATPLPDNW